MTKWMGILNITPDSFFDGDRYTSLESAVLRGEQMEREGADYLDIGGESTRPFASPVGEEEELSRVIPVIRELNKRISIPISIDTMKPKVARKALEAGASFINDVTGFSNPEMVEIAVEAQVPICVMHMKDEQRTMQKSPHYPEGIIPHLLLWFKERGETLIKRGIKKENIYLDPGIGFGKTVTDNLDILGNVSRFKQLGFPLLFGLSRKSFMGKLVNKKPEELLDTTLVLNALLLREGVDILRVHDVKEHTLTLEAPCTIG